MDRDRSSIHQQRAQLAQQIAIIEAAQYAWRPGG